MRVGLFEASGVDRSGFFPDSCVSLVNLKPYKNALRMRNGCKKGFTLSEEIIFVKSLKRGGKSISFVGTPTGIYCMETPAIGVSSLGSKVFSSDMRRSVFFFLAGASIYMCYDGGFYFYDGSEFVSAEAGDELMISDTHVMTSYMTNSMTNALTGVAHIAVTMSNKSSAIYFGEEIDHIWSVKVNGNDVSNECYFDRDVLYLPEEYPAGRRVEVKMETKSSAAVSPYLAASLIGGTAEDFGDCGYVYSSKHVMKARATGPSLFISMPIFSSDSNGIREVFSASGEPCAIVGQSIGRLDRENGELVLFDVDGIGRDASVCTASGCAYVKTGARTLRLSFGTGKSKCDSRIISVTDRFAHHNDLTVLSMAYSGADSELWTIVYDEQKGRNRALVLDTVNECGYEFYIGSEPSVCFEVIGGMGIVSGSSVYYCSYAYSQDINGGTTTPIWGCIELCDSELMLPLTKKRLLRAGASVGGRVSALHLFVTADNGRRDGFSLSSANGITGDRGVLLPVYRMNVGLFNFANLRVEMSGQSGASLHDVSLDLKAQ